MHIVREREVRKSLREIDQAAIIDAYVAPDRSTEHAQEPGTQGWDHGDPEQ
jgi:hypothetical protein